MEDDYATVVDGMADLQKSFTERGDAMRHLMHYAAQMNNDGTVQ